MVVLTGAGRAFSAGGDLNWITSFLDDPVARDESIREGAEIIDEMLRFPLPVIAAVNGPAVGLGCSIAVLCDVVLMSEKAHFADPHVAVGLVAGDGGAAFWPLLTPILRSREYLYTGDKIPAAMAVEFGLATRTTPPGRPVADRPRPRRTVRRATVRGAAEHQTRRQHASLAGTVGPPAGRVRRRGRDHAIGRAPGQAAGAGSHGGRSMTAPDRETSVTEVRDWCAAHVPVQLAERADRRQ